MAMVLRQIRSCSSHIKVDTEVVTACSDTTYEASHSSCVSLWVKVPSGHLGTGQGDRAGVQGKGTGQGDSPLPNLSV